MHAARLGVRGIPAMYLYKDGELMGNQTGALPKAKVLAWIDGAMSDAFGEGTDF
jgi:thioredoxin 1